MARKTFLSIAAVLLAFFAVTAAGQSVLYVDDDALNDPNQDGSSAHPFDAIQKGIDAADPWFNNTVVVLDGTYAGVGNVWLDFGGKAITVRSQSGPEACIIRCTALENAVLFDEYEDSDTVLEGFTITNALGLDAGIACGAWGFPSSPTVHRCIFHGNTVGLRVNAGRPTITNCLFYANNHAVETSWQAPAAQFELINCTVTNNGLGLYHGATTTAWVYNCIVWGNDDDLVVLPDSTLIVYFSDIPDGNSLHGNIDADPWFTDSTYRLSYDSPCVDSGADGYVDTAYDLGGATRIYGQRVDMGAYEMCGPGRAFNPSPSDDATDVSLRPVLSWSNGGGATSYDVYFGEVNPPGPNQLMGNQQQALYQAECLAPSTTYHWRIDSKNSYGTTKGDVWSFTTVFLPPPSGNVIYVNAAATGLNNGRSWRDAFTRLQDALGPQDNAEIWVAAGIYRPDRDAAHPNGSGDRTASFHLANSVVIYGGFVGCETALSQRDPAANVTILSGDLAGDDGPNFTNNGENSYHVVTANRISGHTGALCGFTISGGNAYGSSTNGGGGLLNTDGDPNVDACTFVGNTANTGGGMYNWNGSPNVGHCIFVGNTADSGGGMYLSSGSPTLANCTFSGNSASDSGGGMYLSSGSPTLANCTFSGNSVPGVGGGGLYNGSGNPTLTGCTFCENSTGGHGGGLRSNGGNATLINGTFSGNSAGQNGGGLFVFTGGTATLTNCTLSGNSAALGGGVSVYTSPPATLTNCIVWGNTPSQIAGAATVTYSCVQGGWAGTGNISSDPLFENAAEGNLRLKAGSPCVDAGNNAAAVAAGLLADLDGHTRFLNDPATPDCQWAPGTCGMTPIVDLGAYEFIAGDYDRDGDLDAADLTILQACFSGPSVMCTDDCLKADFDRDGDVDLADFGYFQSCFSGVGRPVDPGCGG